MSFWDICKNLGVEKWIELHEEGEGENAQSALLLKFELVGPAKDLCPICGLFLGTKIFVF